MAERKTLEMKKIENIFWAIVSCIISYSSDTRAIITQQNTSLCNYLYLLALEAHTGHLLGKLCDRQEGPTAVRRAAGSLFQLDFTEMVCERK